MECRTTKDCMIPADFARRLRQFQIRARRAVRGALGGEYRSIFKGSGITFDEVREYSPGDDIRAIDWNVTARSDGAYIKRFEEERENRIVLAIDISSSMRFGSQRTKLEIAAEIAAMLAWCGLSNRDRVGAMTFADTVRTYLPATHRPLELLRIVREIMAPEVAPGRTNIAGALNYFLRVERARTTTFLISDFADDDYETALRIAGRRHDLTLIRVRDPLERRLPDVGRIRVSDRETGAEVVVDTRNRERFEAVSETRRDAFLQNARAARADVIDIRTDSDHAEALIRWFRTRRSRTGGNR